MPVQDPSCETLAELLPDLRRRALRLTGDVAAADDLLQETALKAHLYAASFRPDTCYRAWVFCIMRNLFITSYRKRRREHTALERLSNEMPSALDKPPANEDEILDDTMSRALAELPEQYKAVLALLAKGLKYQEIANTLGCPVGTVMSRIHRARARLRGDIAA